MELRIIDSLQDFMELKDEYLRLIQDNKGLTPFYTHRWLTAWWGAFEEHYKVKVFCVYKQKRLILAIPIAFGQGTFAKLKVKKASFLGGNWGAFDFPVDNEADGWEQIFLSWLFNKEAAEWEVLQFGPLSPFSARVKTLLQVLEDKNVPYKCKTKSNPYLPLSGTWEEFLAQKSKNFRRTIKRKEKKAYNQSMLIRHRLINPTTKELQNTVSEVSKKSWQGQRGLAVASEGKTFYDLLSSEMEEFDIDLSTIYCGGQCIAYLLGLLQGRSYHAFDTGFDPAYADYSPGLLLHFYVLRSLFGSNIDEFHFGYEHSYKERFEPLYFKSLEIVIFRHRFISTFGSLVNGFKGFLNRNSS